MKILICVLCLTLAVTGLIYADHAYIEIATVHDIMEVVQKPNMDAVVAIVKAGGPQSDRDWKKVKKYASVLAESTQLILMGSRVKDEIWIKGANEVIAALQETITAANAKDANAFKAASGNISRGCRTCHTVHKPKKKKH